MSTSTSTAAPGEPTDAARRRGWRRLVPVAVMLVVVGVAAGLPLIRNQLFYYWDDTVVGAGPVWRRMAEVVLSGHFPLLELDMWRGGNFAAEASIGMWNPVALGLAIITYPIDNIAVAITIVKVTFMGILALGSYLLAREYDVRPWLAAAMGAVVPLSGYTMFMDATAWINALMVTSFVPWVWLAARRAINRQGSIVWLIVAGYLCCSLGPYALLATGVILVGVIIEAWVNGDRSRILPILLAGVAIGLLNVVVYLPLLGTQGVGYRAGSNTFNNEFLSPSLTDLAGLSTPALQPFIKAFSYDYFTLPVMFLAWFIIPLAPWLRWRVVRTQWRSLITLFFAGAAFLLLVLGPSNVWLFRWPVRMVVYLWFPVILLWVFVASHGLERSRPKVRAALSAALVLIGGYLAWADQPSDTGRILPGVVAVAILTAVVVWRGLTSRWGITALLAGTLAVTAYHVSLHRENTQTEPYYMPTSQSYLRGHFAKYEGVTVQLATRAGVYVGGAANLSNAYKDVLLGEVYSAAGVESLTAYGGLGYTKMDATMCMMFEGSTTCPRTWFELFSKPDGHPVPLVDLLRAQTVVVQNNLIDTREFPSPPGWRRDPSAEESGLSTVWRRIDPLPFRGGRVSHASGGVVIDADSMSGRIGERIRYHRADASGPARLTFARLAWPGYTATVNGAKVTVDDSGPSGLLVVNLPAGVTSGELELTWAPPPGWPVLGGSFAAGLLVTLGLGLWPVLVRRRRGSVTPADSPGTVDQSTTPVAVG